MAEHESMAADAETSIALDEQSGAGSPETAPKVAPRVSLLEGQPALVIGSVVTVATAVLAAPIPIPEWLKVGLTVVVTLAGVFGIRSKVTPVADPKLADGTRLTP